MRNKTFGDLLKRHRARHRITLRAFCETNKIDPGNWSRLERGMFAAPQNEEKLVEYATALGLTRGTDDWIEFFDVAAASKGEIPKDLLDDDELVGKLPALFRTLRATAVSPDKLDDLAERIRKA